MPTRLYPAFAVASLLGLALASAAVSYGAATLMQQKAAAREVASAAGEITASVSPAENTANDKGKSTTGLPLPRFVTLKADKVNVRRGPSSDHPVAFMFQRKGMPVEITAEFENWRKIRDSDGAEGWILQSMLSGRRNAYVAAWSGNGEALELHDAPKAQSGVSARLSPGVLASIGTCDGRWCEISTGDYDGYARQDRLWGVYPGEIVD
jgi:SH3-like domain-containing protein